VTGDWAATPLTVLTRVRPGAAPDLAACLAGLPTGTASPFTRLTSTHFARWVIASTGRPGLPLRRRPPADTHFLLFTTTFNSPVDAFLDELCDRLGAEADAVWGHCVGYPGHDRPAEFAGYLRRHSLPVRQWFRAYDATVAEVHAALRLRGEHLALAREAQNLGDAELLEAFRARFGG